VHRFEREVEALPFATGVGYHPTMPEGTDLVLLGKPRQAPVTIAMRQRVKRIEQAKRLTTGHFRIERSFLRSVADLCAKARTIATGI
jgi:hypothetical protein